MGSKISSFGKTADGKEVSLITLVNKNGMGIEVTNYGATLVAVTVADRDGRIDDVVLGYDDVTDYTLHGGYLGATVGRNCNRIHGAKVAIDGKEYILDDNENGNNLHSGFHGYNSLLWDFEVIEEELAVKFTHHSADGEQGFPGNFDITVTYTLTEENEVKIHYCGTSDKDTIANLTNHSYFNLKGHDGGTITDHMVTIKANCFTGTGSDLIPDGSLVDVTGKPMDFREPRKIGDDIDSDYEPIVLAGGYDHNFVLDKPDGAFAKVCEVTESSCGRTMEVYTDLPGMQLYTGNFINREEGKAVYTKRTGICFETQFFPNSINVPEFKSCLLKAGEEFNSTTMYKFL